MQRAQDFLIKVFPNLDIYVVAKDLVYILITLVLARIGYALLNFLLKKILIKEQGSTYILKERRAKTLYPLLRSILFYAVSFFALLTILPLIGVKTTTILASVSVLGLAVGFGAQSLVKDVISGFFIIFEDQFAVGEYVSIDKFDGIVEEIGLRATKLRAWGGELHVIPNGTITSVTNFNQGKMRALVDINLAYDQDVEKAMEVIDQVGQVMAKEYEGKIVEGPTVQGIINLGDAFFVLRTIAYTLPMEQWDVERELRRRIIRSLAEVGIQIPSIRKAFVESKRV